MNVTRLAYLVLMGVAATLSFIKLFLLGRYLTKEGFGDYVYLNAIVTYALPFASLGILEGLSRRFPILLGSGNALKADRLRNAALAATTLIGICVFTVVLSVTAIAGHQTLFVYAVLIVLEVYAFTLFFFAIRDLRNRLKSELYAGSLAVRAVLEIAIIPFAASRFGVVGVLGAETVTLVLVALAVFFVYVPNVGLDFASLGSTRDLMIEGSLIAFGGVLAITGRMSDRLVLGTTMPKSEFAEYGFHLLVFTGAMVIVNMLYQYITPRALHIYGEHNNHSLVLRYLEQTSRRIALAVFVFGFAVVPLFHVVAKTFFKGYSVNSLLLLTLYGAGALEVVNVFGAALLARGKLALQAVIHGVAGLFVVGGSFAAIRLSGGFLVFAMLLFTGRLITFLLTLYFTYRGPDETKLAPVPI